MLYGLSRGFKGKETRTHIQNYKCFSCNKTTLRRNTLTKSQTRLGWAGLVRLDRNKNTGEVSTMNWHRTVDMRKL